MGQLLEWMGCEREERFLLHGFLDCSVVVCMPHFLENEFSVFDIALVNSHFNCFYFANEDGHRTKFLENVSVFSRSLRLVTHW